MVDETSFMEALRAKQDEWLTEYEQELFNTPTKAHSTQRDQEIEILRDKLDLLTKHLNERDFRFSKPVTDEILKQIDCAYPADSFEYNKVCYKTLSAMRETHEIFLQKRISDFLYRPQHLIQNTKTSVQQNRLLLSNLVDEFIKHKINNNAYAGRTAAGANGILSGFVRIIGNAFIDDIDYKVMDTFIANAQKLKKGWNNKENQNKHIKDLFSTKGEQTLSKTTINNWITGYISPMFEYAVRREYMRKNPSKGSTFRKASRDATERQYFSDEQLQKLFHSERYINDTFKKPSEFWLPILGYVTGARIEELCQLKRNDIITVDEICCISINEDDDDQNIKAATTKRDIPFHQTLIDLGFLDYVNKFKPDQRIFPELKLIKGRYSHSVSRWFGEYTIKVGVRESKDSKSVFHSFRHGIVSYAANQDLREDMRKRYTGHAEQGGDRSYKHVEIKALKQHFVDKLVLPVSLDHLRNSKWTK